MKLEEQVLTIEQMQHLKELGLEVKDTAMCWAVGEMSFQDVKLKHQSVLTMDSKPQKYEFIKEVIPTLTLQEVLDLLPEKIGKFTLYTAFHHSDLCPSMIWYAQDYYMINGEVLRYFEIGNPLQTAYEMLCWCAENGYLNNKENENN